MLARALQMMRSQETILLFSTLGDKRLVFPRCHPTIPNSPDTRTHGRGRASAYAVLVIT